MSEGFDLNGKIALVTGAGQGLGKSFAKALSKAGATVVIMARNYDRLIRTAEEITIESGKDVYPVQVDITNEDSVASAVKYIRDSLKHIDILVNNAALGRSDVPLQDETLDSWNTIIGTNLTGTFLMMKHVGRIMISQRSGKIINLSSMAGRVGMRNPSVGAYDVSKAGIIGLTKAMAGAWAEYNVTVNAIAPGYYMTDINRDYVKKHPDFYEDSIKHIPLKTWGDEKRIGDVAVFLASSASDYMTGAILVVDGGYTTW